MSSNTDSTTPTEQIEQTETGVRIHIRSTRGTGTRDQDKVSVEGKFENMEELEAHRNDLVNACTEELNRLRENQPDSE